jgi:peptidyl-prolyl cis-trans isomerase SurA
MKRLTLFLTCASLLAPAVGMAQTRELSASGTPLDKIVAIVNDGVVLKSQVDQQVAAILARLRGQETQLPSEQVISRQVLERLIVQEVQAQRAERLGLKVSDETLNAALQDVASRNSIAFEQMPAALEAQGVDYAAYREDTRREIVLTLLRQRDVLSRIYVSPRELEQALEKRTGRAGEDTEYDVSHILLSLPESASPTQLAEVERQAQAVYERAVRGDDFGQLALTYSQSQSALDRGKLGWRRLAQLPQFIAEQAVSMEPGQVAGPLRTPTGFHILRLDEVRGVEGPMMVEQIHARHILMRPTEVQDDATTRQRLADIRQRILGGEDFGALASITSEDPSSAAQGGDLGWTVPGTFVPQFEEVLDGLQQDEISEPFRTQYGWHIVQKLGRRTHDQSDEVLRQRVLATLRESKADEETELWLRRLRDDAYVEYRGL